MALDTAGVRCGTNGNTVLVFCCFLPSPACKLAPQMAACDLMMKRVAGVWPGLGVLHTRQDTEL